MLFGYSFAGGYLLKDHSGFSPWQLVEHLFLEHPKQPTEQPAVAANLVNFAIAIPPLRTIRDKYLHFFFTAYPLIQLQER